MAVTIANQIYDTAGSQRKVTARITLDSSYPTGGYALTAAQFAMSRFTSIISDSPGGYTAAFGSFATQPSSVLMPIYSGASGTTGATSAGTPAGTNSAPAFTGTSPVSSLDLATPAFSGTGLTASGQVITTTSTHTMTLNQCAGMWLIPATGATPPMLILSNTAVSGAAAVLTVQGSASTDAGAYKIVKSLTPIGSVAAPVFTGSALATHTHTVGAAAGGEVANGTNLSTVSFEIEVYGY